MNTINITIMNIETLEIESINFVAPSFIVDTFAFQKRVESAYVDVTLERLTDKVNNISDKLYNAENDGNLKALEEIKGDLEAAKEALETFKDYFAEEIAARKYDSISLAYVIATGLASAKIAGYENIHVAIKSYGLKYLGNDDFTDERKADVMNVRRAVNEWLKGKFGTRDLTVYKDYDFTLNATFIDRLVAATIGKATRADVDGNRGISLKPISKTAGAVQCLRMMFAKYGCEVVKEKKQKTSDKITL